MKVRNGFVSNSSSSSFIVAFKTKPQSSREVLELLFPHGETEVTWDDYETRSTTAIADRVFDDLQTAEEVTPEIDPDEYLMKNEKPSRTLWQKIYRLARFGGVDHPDQIAARERWDARPDGPPDEEERELYAEWRQADDMFKPPNWEDMENDGKWRSMYRIEQRNYRRWLLGYVKEWIKKVKGWCLYKLRYSDNDDGDALLEHGNIFKNIPHLRISNH